MTAEILVDTNVLVYAYDLSAKTSSGEQWKYWILWPHSGLGVLSTQVLGESFLVATQKLSPPLSKAEAYESIANLTRSWKVLEVTGLIVLEAAKRLLNITSHLGMTKFGPLASSTNCL